jgi:hypothetical protein
MREKVQFHNWMTGWLLIPFLSTPGIVDVPDFDETCKRM